MKRDRGARLNAGDLVYDCEHAPNAFINETDDGSGFVELFDPEPCATVVVAGANLCAWLPTVVDRQGRRPIRYINYHVRDRDDGIKPQSMSQRV